MVIFSDWKISKKSNQLELFIIQIGDGTFSFDGYFIISIYNYKIELYF